MGIDKVSKTSHERSEAYTKGLKSTGKDKENMDAEKMTQKIDDNARKDMLGIMGG